MKVKQLIKELSKYDKNKEVFFMEEHPDDDITIADEIHKVEQRTLTRDEFEISEFVAVILLHEVKQRKTK